MENEKEVHDVFLANPIDFTKYVNCFVKITLVNNDVILGTVYTIDPVSQSVVLITKEKTEDMSLKIILRHAIASMEIQSEVPELQKNVLSVDFFNSSQSLAVNKNLKEDVKNWLTKNMIPVVEDGEKLVVDTLEIVPPYGIDQCYCSNPIVLSRIQNLLKKLNVKES